MEPSGSLQACNGTALPFTHFCYRLSYPQGHGAAGGIMSMKNSNDTIGNRTRELPDVKAVSQPTAPLRTFIFLRARYRGYSGALQSILDDSCHPKPPRDSKYESIHGIVERMHSVWSGSILAADDFLQFALRSWNFLLFHVFQTSPQTADTWSCEQAGHNSCPTTQGDRLVIGFYTVFLEKPVFSVRVTHWYIFCPASSVQFCWKETLGGYGCRTY
jgi:hypothetical protein